MRDSRWTRDRVAQALGLSPTSVSRICAGTQKPTPEIAVKLEKLTGTPAWDWVKPTEAA